MLPSKVYKAQVTATVVYAETPVMFHDEKTKFIVIADSSIEAKERARKEAHKRFGRQARRVFITQIDVKEVSACAKEE